MTSLSLVGLLFLFFLGFGWRRDCLDDLRFELFQALKLALEDVLFPDEHLVEFTVSDDNLIKFAQVLRVGVHDTEHPQPVVLDRFDGVAIEGQRLQICETVKLLGLV